MHCKVCGSTDIAANCYDEDNSYCCIVICCKNCKHEENIKQEIMHSDTEFSCPDYCIYDAGYNCKQCSRYKNTLYYKLQKNH
jgi:hypothetical protein